MKSEGGGGGRHNDTRRTRGMAEEGYRRKKQGGGVHGSLNWDWSNWGATDGGGGCGMKTVVVEPLILVRGGRVEAYVAGGGCGGGGCSDDGCLKRWCGG